MSIGGVRGNPGFVDWKSDSEDEDISVPTVQQSITPLRSALTRSRSTGTLPGFAHNKRGIPSLDNTPKSPQRIKQEGSGLTRRASTGDLIGRASSPRRSKAAPAHFMSFPDMPHREWEGVSDLAVELFEDHSFIRAMSGAKKLHTSAQKTAHYFNIAIAALRAKKFPEAKAAQDYIEDINVIAQIQAEHAIVLADSGKIKDAEGIRVLKAEPRQKVQAAIIAAKMRDGVVKYSDEPFASAPLLRQWLHKQRALRQAKEGKEQEALATIQSHISDIIILSDSHLELAELFLKTHIDFADIASDKATNPKSKERFDAVKEKIALLRAGAGDYQRAYWSSMQMHDKTKRDECLYTCAIKLLMKDKTKEAFLIATRIDSVDGQELAQSLQSRCGVRNEEIGALFLNLFGERKPDSKSMQEY